MNDNFNIDINKSITKDETFKTLYNEHKNDKSETIKLQVNGEEVEIQKARFLLLFKNEELIKQGLLHKGQDTLTQIKIAEHFDSLSEESKRNFLNCKINKENKLKLLFVLDSKTNFTAEIKDLIERNTNPEKLETNYEAIIKSYKYEEVRDLIKNWKELFGNTNSLIDFLGKDGKNDFDEEMIQKLNDVLKKMNNKEKVDFIRKVKVLSTQISDNLQKINNAKKINSQLDLVEKFRNHEVEKEDIFVKIIKTGAEILNESDEKIIQAALNVIEGNINSSKIAKEILEESFKSYRDVIDKQETDIEKIMRELIKNHSEEIIQQIKIDDIER